MILERADGFQCAGVKTDCLHLRVSAMRGRPAVAELGVADYDAPLPAPEIPRDVSGQVLIRPHFIMSVPKKVVDLRAGVARMAA